jgi:hypothetical protein
MGCTQPKQSILTHTILTHTIPTRLACPPLPLHPFLPPQQARVSVLDSGFMLGDGVWEGIRLHKGVLAFAKTLYEGTKQSTHSTNTPADHAHHSHMLFYLPPPSPCPCNRLVCRCSTTALC